jgi:hypothetical protein
VSTRLGRDGERVHGADRCRWRTVNLEIRSWASRERGKLERAANREPEAEVVREDEGHGAMRLGHARTRLVVSVTIGDGRQW